MRSIYLFLVLFLLNGFTQDNRIKVGCYKSQLPNIIDRYWRMVFQGISGWAMGSEIIINNDSTCTYSTCSAISTGYWSIHKDSLFLNINQSRWKNDSLNKYGYKGTWPKIPSKPFGFKIDKDYIERIDLSKNGHKYQILLKFNAP
jgi:hypothetical protein